MSDMKVSINLIEYKEKIEEMPTTLKVVDFVLHSPSGSVNRLVENKLKSKLLGMMSKGCESATITVEELFSVIFPIDED